MSSISIRGGNFAGQVGWVMCQDGLGLKRLIFGTDEAGGLT